MLPHVVNAFPEDVFSVWGILNLTFTQVSLAILNPLYKVPRATNTEYECTLLYTTLSVVLLLSAEWLVYSMMLNYFRH
jgi:hypothetical protein